MVTSIPLLPDQELSSNYIALINYFQSASVGHTSGKQTWRRSMMMKPNNRGSRRKLVLALSALAAASLVGGTAAGMANAQEPPTADEYNLKVLDSVPADSNLPYQISDAETSVLKDSLRALVEHDGTQYWVGLDEESNVCLVALFGSAEWVSGESCTTPEMFAHQGAGLRLYGPEGLVEAYLVPDGVTVDKVADAIATNLYVVEPYTPTAERSVSNLRAADNTDGGFGLALFEEPFTLEDPK